MRFEKPVPIPRIKDEASGPSKKRKLDRLDNKEEVDMFTYPEYGNDSSRSDYKENIFFFGSKTSLLFEDQLVGIDGGEQRQARAKYS